MDLPLLALKMLKPEHTPASDAPRFGYTLDQIAAPNATLQSDTMQCIHTHVGFLSPHTSAPSSVHLHFHAKRGECKRGAIGVQLALVLEAGWAAMQADHDRLHPGLDWDGFHPTPE